MNTVLGLLGVALAWIFYGLTIVGLGSLFLGLICRAALLSFSCCFWVGLALLVTALQILNLCWGINLFVVRPTCLLGLFCLWLFRKRLDVSFWHRLKPWYSLLAGLVVLWVADRALADPGVYDSGLYHFSSVRWANEQPLPPGLGNLHGRLAYNQSYFLLVSFVNLLPRRGDGHNFTNSLLLVFTIITILEVGGEITADRTRKTIFLLLGALTFFFALLFNKTNEPGISSPSPDVAMVCLQLAMFSLALAVCNQPAAKRSTADQTGRAGSPSRPVLGGRLGDPPLPQGGSRWAAQCTIQNNRRTIQVAAVLLLSGLAVTFKLSSIVFSLGIALLVIAVYLFTPEQEGLSSRIVPSLVTLLVLSVVWVARSVIASGYLIYPITATACPVAWRVPPDRVRDEANWIFSWAREPGVHWSKVLADWSWFWPCSTRIAGRPDFVFTSCLFGFASLLLVIFWLKAPKAMTNALRRCTDFVSLGAVCVASIFFWFLTSPDPRFLGAIFALLSVSLFGIALEAVESGLGFSLAATMGTAIFGFGFYLALSANGLGLVELRKRQIGSRIPKYELIQRATDSGLQVWVPVEGYQVGNAPLPATPYFRRDLRLRGDGLRSGFCVQACPDPKIQ